MDFFRLDPGRFKIMIDPDDEYVIWPGHGSSCPVFVRTANGALPPGLDRDYATGALEAALDE